MQVRKTVQKLLDATLLKYGIMSHHLRFVESTKVMDGAGNTIAINKDEYVVYRIVSSQNVIYGDGKAQLQRYYVDVNYYYSYDKNDARTADAEARIDEIIKAFLADDHFKLANGQSDLYDIDNPYRGINVEFSYYKVSK